MRASFDERLPWLIGLHTSEEDETFFCDQIFSKHSVWGAFDSGKIVGVIAFRDGWVDQLYILPSHQGHGFGTTLLAIAKENNVTLSLRTFQRNVGAQRFYERHGFVAVQQTDGNNNEEREPDILYSWERPIAD